PFDLLMSVLKGTKESLGMLNASLPRTNETQSARLVPASFTPSPGMPDNRYSRVQQALESHCPRGTTFRTLHCLALILGPLAFPNAATRIPLIAGVLVLFPCPNGDRYSLATTLAAL